MFWLSGFTQSMDAALSPGAPSPLARSGSGARGVARRRSVGTASTEAPICAVTEATRAANTANASCATFVKMDIDRNPLPSSCRRPPVHAGIPTNSTCQNTLLQSSGRKARSLFLVGRDRRTQLMGCQLRRSPRPSTARLASAIGRDIGAMPEFVHGNSLQGRTKAVAASIVAATSSLTAGSSN